MSSWAQSCTFISDVAGFELGFFFLAHSVFTISCCSKHRKRGEQAFISQRVVTMGGSRVWRAGILEEEIWIFLQGNHSGLEQGACQGKCSVLVRSIQP